MGIRRNGRKKSNDMSVERLKYVGINIEQFVKKNEIKSIAITSAVKGEGKSSILSELVNFYGDLNDKRVIVIDCNFKNPSISRNFNAMNNKGLYEALNDYQSIEEIIIRINKSVDILGLGCIKNNEFIDFRKLGHILDILSTQYDLVLLDTPSILDSADTAIIAQKSDAVFMVINAHKVKREQVINADEKLKISGSHIAGIIINDYIMGTFNDEKIFI